MGKEVSGICRAAKAAGEFRLLPLRKRASSHTPTASGFILELSALCVCHTSIVLMHQVWTFASLCLYLCLCLCRRVNQALVCLVCYYFIAWHINLSRSVATTRKRCIKLNCATDSYQCSLFHLHKIHLCTCSYRIPGCCYTLHYHYSYALHWHTRLYLKQQKQPNWKTFNWNGVIQNVSLWHSVSPWFFAIFLPHVK